MKVKSKVNTKRLVKGAIYDVMKLHGSNPNNLRYFRPRVVVKLTGNLNQNFSVNNFTLEDGRPIPQIDWTSDEHKMNHIDLWSLRITETNLKEGDYVVYIRNTHSSLITNRKYKVEKIYHTKFGSYSEIKIKIEGSTRFYKSFSFRKCTAEEVRETNLKLVFDESSDLAVVNTKKRKFDFFTKEEQEKILMEIIFKSAIDKNRNNLSILEWAISRVEPTMKLRKEDFEEIMNKDLKSIIEKL
jgi:hypothetical protein